MNKDIRNYNHKKQHHGYQEWYFGGELYLRGNFKNNRIIGYIEWCGIKQTYFHIK